MDMSKLPKLSQTPAPPPGETQEPVVAAIPLARNAAGDPHGPASVAAEAWISIGIGLLLLILTPNTVGYFSAKVFHTKFGPYPDPTQPYPAKCDFIQYLDGTKEFYRDRLEFWSDLAITAFAITLMLDGVIIARARRPKPVLIVFCVTVAATVGNLFYLVKTLSGGLPLISACAVIFGGYMAIYQWNLYKALSASKRA